MTQFASPMIRRLLTASLAAGAAVTVFAATPAAAEIHLQFGLQDRDMARMVSLGGSCNRCELSGRDLSGGQLAPAVRVLRLSDLCARANLHHLCLAPAFLPRVPALVDDAGAARDDQCE